MKKTGVIWVLAGLLCLCGCSEEVYETIADEPAVSVSAQCRQIVVSLPEGTITPTAQTEGVGEVYECDGYTVTVQTLEAGDLDESLYTMTGYRRDELQLIESVKEDCKRYDAVFTAAGEGSLQVGRVCILDDGAYHYAVSTVAPEELAGDLRSQWEDIYSSFRLVDGSVDLNTGS